MTVQPKFQWPLTKAEVVRFPGKKKQSGPGIWVSTKDKASVFPVEDGTIVFVGAMQGMVGQTMIVSHKAAYSFYGPLLTDRKAGESIAVEETIGKVLGKRLYLQIRLRMGSSVVPVRPQRVLDGKGR